MHQNNTDQQPITGSTPIAPLALPFTLSGNKIGIVIIHGYGGSIADYRSIAEKLQAHGYSVFGARLFGHGQGQEVLRRSTVADWQASVNDVMNEARESCTQIFILGSSFGGVLVLDYVANHGQVAGMILVNTALSYSGASIFQGLILRLMKLFRSDYPKKGLSDEEKAYAKNVGSSVAWPINGILATAKFARQAVRPELHKITTPALIMHSQNDPVVGIQNSEKLTQLLGSITKQIMTIPVATHRPFRDQTANEYMAKQINHFIQHLAKT